MKKAFSTLACMGLPWQQVLSCAAEAGMDAVEIRLDSQNRVFGLPDEALPTLAAAFRENGVGIRDLGTSLSIRDYAPEKLAEIRRYAAMAKTLGAQGIRVFLGSFIQRFSDPRCQTEAGIVRFLQEAADTARQQDVEIWIETHSEFSTGASLRPLLDQVNRRNVRVIWDILHSIEFGEAPEETLRRIGKDIVHVHIKDGIPQGDPDRIEYCHTRLGEGSLPIAHILKLLKSAGYQGLYSLEWESQWREEIRHCYPTLPQLLNAWNDFLVTLRMS